MAGPPSEVGGAGNTIARRNYHIPLAKCRVLYLGSAVPIETSKGKYHYLHVHVKFNIVLGRLN